MQRALPEGSLRALGVTTLPCDKATKARLKRLAGDTPLCLMVRELVDLAEGVKSGSGGQVPLPGQERLVSSNTIPAIKQEVVALRSEIATMLAVLGLSWPLLVGHALGKDSTCEFMVGDLARSLSALPNDIRTILQKALVSQAASSQQLSLTEGGDVTPKEA